eukprot:jgi/Picre1/30889/NNA_006248.t1
MSTPAICRALRCTPRQGAHVILRKDILVKMPSIHRDYIDDGVSQVQPPSKYLRRFGVAAEEIDASEVRVIGEDKEPLGIMSRSEALQMAEDQEVDLILVVPGATPPVCRLIEYSKFNYEKTKAEKDAKKKQRENAIETKELKMRPGTDVHDYQVKVRAAQKFIDKGFRVKLTLQFRGREMEFKDIGREMFDRFVEDLGGPGEVSIEQAAKMQGRQMNMILAKKEVVQA